MNSDTSLNLLGPGADATRSRAAAGSATAGSEGEDALTAANPDRKAENFSSALSQAQDQQREPAANQDRAEDSRPTSPATETESRAASETESRPAADASEENTTSSGEQPVGTFTAAREQTEARAETTTTVMTAGVTVTDSDGSGSETETAAVDIAPLPLADGPAVAHSGATAKHTETDPETQKITLQGVEINGHSASAQTAAAPTTTVATSVEEKSPSQLTATGSAEATELSPGTEGSGGGKALPAKTMAPNEFRQGFGNLHGDQDHNSATALATVETNTQKQSQSQLAATGSAKAAELSPGNVGSGGGKALPAGGKLLPSGSELSARSMTPDEFSQDFDSLDGNQDHNAETGFSGERQGLSISKVLTEAMNRLNFQNQLLAEASPQAAALKTGEAATPAPASVTASLDTAMVLPGSSQGMLERAGMNRPTTPASPGLESSLSFGIRAEAGTADWDSQVSNRIRWLGNMNVSAAELKLHPAELGAVEISIATEEDQTRVSFITSNAAAREIIESSMPRLRELLADSGLQLTQGDVAHDTAAEQNEHADGGNRAAMNAEEAELAEEAHIVIPRSGLGQIDHYV